MAESDYIKENDTLQKEQLSQTWKTAIGLQKVDCLSPSQYLMDTAQQNINGKISLNEAENLIQSYYKQERKKPPQNTYEADIVSTRIVKILSERGFSLTPIHYINIHKRLFDGIYKFAGKIRDYNISKKEWVLDGASVFYGLATELEETLKYDISQEKSYSYKGLNMQQTLKHLAKFVSALWQNHIFGEGNTRTTAVFFIEYLRTLGFSVTNQSFEKNSWYFRNALVRANYTDIQKNIHATTEYMELFLENLLLNQKHELKNRTLHIRYLMENINIPKLNKDIMPNINNPKEIPLDGFHTALERFDRDRACGVCGDWKVERNPSSPALWIALYKGETVVECDANGDDKAKEQGGDIRRIMNITDRAFKGICDLAHGVFPTCRMSPDEQKGLVTKKYDNS